MTLQELSRFARLKEKLAQNQEMLDALRCKASPRSPVLDGMPHAPGTGDKVGYLAVAISDLESEMEELKTAIAAEGHCLERYIRSINNSRVRIIFTLRFLECLSWGEVADTMGPYYSEDSVKRIVYAHIRSQEDEA